MPLKNKVEMEWLIQSLSERVNNVDTEVFRLLGDVYYHGLSGKEQNIKADFIKLYLIRR